MLSNVADLTEVLSSMAIDGHPVITAGTDELPFWYV
jgi:hypothetical protein